MPGPLWTGKAIVALTLHKPKLIVQRFDLIFMAVLYAYAFNWCYQTAGVPYAAFMAKIQAEEEAEPTGEDVVVVDDSGDMQSNIFDTVLKEAVTEEKSWWETAADEAEQHADMVPYTWQPDFWPLFLLSAVLTLTVLLWLGQDWSVNFRAWIRCTKANDLKEASVIKVIPRPHRGKADLVPLEGKDTKKPYFVFQKQRFEYNAAIGKFEKVAPPMKEPIKFYLTAEPYDSRKKVADAAAHYGPNRFEIPLPTFGDMYKEQIKAPFFVFQIFCVLLWCLEEYWQYSLFSLVMILGFEASVVMTRRMNITKLRGMGNKATSCQVYRYDQWQTISTEELLPGDHIRLKSGGKGDEAIIPCDCFLLKGSAVVNEATLTGESVPLMKEPASMAEGDRALDIKTLDKIHTLFGGTKLMEAKGEDNEDWCEAYVLRTGFTSSQGKLVRRIEFSTEKVSGDTRDAGWLLVFLLIFAIAASGYVLNRGLQEERSRYDLLIHCILIVTSVVPPDLPMQMAIAINTSLSTLMSMQVFCIEPFRIPMAGKVKVACFDKTGTITTDRLHAAGVVSSSGMSKKKKEHKGGDGDLEPMLQSPYEACLVIGGCHSLVTAAGQTVGDPLESASLQAIGWRYNSSENVAGPIQSDKPSKKTAGSCPPNTTIRIAHRHHFASKLQRMSVVADVKGSHEGTTEQCYVLAKGSPEMVETLLDKGQGGAPKWFTECHRQLAKKGYRVIALAYKKVPSAQRAAMIADRDNAEKNLSFAGFVAFNCKNRADSKRVITELRESAHTVIMITGDAILTAAHVGCETNIVNEDKDKVLMLTLGENDTLEWTRFSDDKTVETFKASEIPNLAKQYDLCVSGEGLAHALEVAPETKMHLHRIFIYARMKPEQKEQVLVAIKATGNGTLMCGDGTNDVGALKAADVGVALLSGFGDVNAEKEGDKKAVDTAPPEPGKIEVDEDGNIVFNAAEQAWINDPMVNEQVRAKRREDLKKRKEFQKVYEERKATGEWFAFIKATMVMAERQQRELLEKRRREEEEKLKKPQKQLQQPAPSQAVAQLSAPGSPAVQDSKKPKMPASPWDMLESGEGIAESEMVKLGDASIAAPFTSKMPSIHSTMDIIRQGRCTLVNTLQMYQILALNCLISSYSLSVLYLDGVKYGDKQMTLMGVLSTICFLCISKGTSLPKLAPVHPPDSIFHPALFVSLCGQFAIHLGTIMYTTHIAKMHLPADWKPDLKGKFKPSVINTVVFLTSCVQQVSVFTVNYKGRPYMQSLVENTFFTTCLMVFAVATVALATEALPFVNKWFELTPLDSAELKQAILAALGLDALGVLLWDRLMTLVFMPELRPYLKISGEDIRRVIKPLLWSVVLIYILLGTLEAEIEEGEKLAAAQSVTATAAAVATSAAEAVGAF